MKSSVDLTIVKHPSQDELNTKDFAKDFENEDLTELFKTGNCKVDWDSETFHTILDLSIENKDVLFIFTILDWVLPYRTFVMNGEHYTINSKIVFDEFDRDKLKTSEEQKLIFFNLNTYKPPLKSFI